jgi:iron transport multicopper oxidase
LLIIPCLQWGTGVGNSLDDLERLFVVTGNDFPRKVADFQRCVSLDCNPLPENQINIHGLGNSVIRINLNNLQPEQHFAPYDTDLQNRYDKDLGSSALLILPLEWGTAAHPRLGVTGGKSGKMFLLDLDHLGGWKMGSGGTDAVLATFIFTDAGTSTDPNAYPNRSVILSSLSLNPVDGLIYATVWGYKIHAMKIQHQMVNGVETWSIIEVGRLDDTTNTEPNASTLIVSTNGNTPGTAIPWQTGTGRCYAYSGVPDAAGKLHQIAFMQVGNTNKFHMPALTTSMVYKSSLYHTMSYHIISYPIPSQHVIP